MLMPDSASSKEALAGLTKELGSDFRVLPRVIDNNSTPEDIAAAMADTTPSVVVLMNNPTLRLFRKFRDTAPPRAASVPAVALLSSFLKQSAGGIAGLSGVIYEVPLLTSLVNLRDLLDQPLTKVGVIHRPSFVDFVQEQRQLASAEGFEVIGIEVEGDSTRALRNAVNELTKKGVHALWVLNDNTLLSRLMLRRGWLPALRGNKAPVLVNVGSLLSRRVPFGTYGVLPDHEALGSQAANLVVSAAEGRATTTLEYPVSVQTILDAESARGVMNFRKDSLATVDRLVE